MSRLEVLGIVPARAGSKRVLRKNLAVLAGRPLLAYTAEAALRSRYVTRTILTTDSGEIAAVGRDVGLEVPFLRPPELAGDEINSLAVIEHVIGVLAAEGFRPDLIVLLQPTSPLRRAEHIDAAVDLVLQTGADSVVSITPVNQPLSWFRMVGPAGEVISIPFGEGVPDRVHCLNGAVYVTRPSVIASGRILGSDTRALVISAEESVDIDTPLDMVWAEFLLERRRYHGRSTQS